MIGRQGGASLEIFLSTMPILDAAGLIQKSCGIIYWLNLD
jgi:hypothetical protein